MGDRISDEALYLQGGSDDDNAPRAPQQLSGSGATEAHNSTALTLGSIAILYNAPTSVPIRFSLRKASGGGAQVGGTHRVLGAGSYYRWRVQDNTKHAYVEAEDGSSSYEAHVWNNSPGNPVQQ